MPTAPKGKRRFIDILIEKKKQRIEEETDKKEPSTPVKKPNSS